MNQKKFDPGPKAKVDMLRSGTRSTLIFAKTLSHPPERVWEALTDPAQIKQWAPYEVSRNLSKTGSAQLTMIDGMSEAEFPTNISRAVKPKLLEYTWGEDVLVWELEPEGKGTRLTLKHTVESPDWIPKVAAGWHLCIRIAELMMDGTPHGRILGNDAMNYGWQELHDEYAEMMEIDVAED